MRFSWDPSTTSPMNRTNYPYQRSTTCKKISVPTNTTNRFWIMSRGPVGSYPTLTSPQITFLGGVLDLGQGRIGGRDHGFEGTLL